MELIDRDFEFIIDGDQAVLKKYRGSGISAIVPEQADGKEVVRIGDYAFAENRRMEEVFLPDSVRTISRHAFYNCRRLKKISVPGGLLEVEDGALKNCESLSELKLRRAEAGNTCLKHLLYEQNHAVHVTIAYKEAVSGSHTACLYFPAFEYEFVANEPARIFSEIGYGAGYLYQQCFFDKDVDYRRYDSVFSSACVSETLETLGEIALLRLSYPYRLQQEAEEAYQAYLRKNVVRLGISLLEKEDWDLFLLLEKTGLFSAEILPEFIREAGSRRLGKGVAWLLNYQKTQFPAKEKNFEL